MRTTPYPNRRSTAAAILMLTFALLAPPAFAVDDDLMNPNDCDFGSGRVSSGTVVVQPPGSPTTPEGTPSPSPTVVNGVPQSDVYMCIGGHWVWIGTAFEVGPVLPDSGGVTVAEGSLATMDGIVTDADDSLTELTATFGSVTLYPGGAWTWSGTPDDGPATVPVAIGATVNYQPVSGIFAVEVTNVPPTVTSLVPDQAVALVGQQVTFTGTADDPSAADTAAGFTWDVYPLSFDTCGSRTATGTATDKDGGESEAFISEPVQVVHAAYEAPLMSGARNVVSAGQIVPVRVSFGCDGTSVGGLAPTIDLVSGDVDPATTTAYAPVYVIPAADATGDTSGVMRQVGDSYLYNLRIPKAPSGSLFTVRVRPSDGSGAISVVLQVR